MSGKGDASSRVCIQGGKNVVGKARGAGRKWWKAQREGRKGTKGAGADAEPAAGMDCITVEGGCSGTVT